METQAVIFRQPRKLELGRVALSDPGPGEVLVDVSWSGISTGTERLLWTGDMPPFPGMGYPLVPGYETVGRVRRAGPDCTLDEGAMVFVPGARCFGEIRGLFGGAAARLVVPEDKALPVNESLGDRATLLALAATAYHALRPAPDASLPELIVGHGVLGRLLARLTVALGGDAPVVWEREPGRRNGAAGYAVIDPGQDDGTYGVILDASGDAAIIDRVVPHLKHGGEIVLAGFYSGAVHFDFPPAFMREARMRIAAEWQPRDFQVVRRLAESGDLDLDGLITHRLPAAEAEQGYRTAFEDPDCLKMILDWKGVATC
ncbi:MAG: chlorophyll synthesis pathway protein BchC [Gammaproteobacteria bacterium]